MRLTANPLHCYCSDESHSIVTIQGVRYLRCRACHSLTDMTKDAEVISKPSFFERLLTALRNPTKNEPVYGREMTPEKSWRVIRATAAVAVTLAAVFAVMLPVIK